MNGEWAPLVGMEATAEPRLIRIWCTEPRLSIAAARGLSLVAARLSLIAARFSLIAARGFLAFLICLIVASDAAGQQVASPAVAGRHVAGPEVGPDPIEVSSDSIYRWRIGDADASLLEGHCIIQQAGRQMTADSILLVVDGAIGQVRNRLVMSGLREAGRQQSDQPQAATIWTLAEPTILSPRYRGEPKEPPKLLEYLPDSGALTVGSLGAIRQVQFQQPIEPQQNMELNAPAPITLSDGATTGGFQFFVGGGTRSVEVLARGASMPPQIETLNRPETGETLIVARGGVTVLIRDVTAQLPGGELLELGTISLSADRIVGWLPLVTRMFDGTTDLSQAQGELYLEGDIVFRQGERIIYAESMYYNVSAEQGMVLDAEAITTIPEYLGIVRLKADVLQQVARGNFIAFDAAITSSRMGVPRYWLQSEQLTLTDREQLVSDPITGMPTIDREPFVNSSNNFVYFSGVPLLYWPTMSTSLQQPTYYVSGVKVKNDSIFGTQLLLDFDLFQILGIDSAPPGVQWSLSTDYLSNRGPAIGTTLEYHVPSLFGVPGPVNGFFDSWIIQDHGLDTLGVHRRNLVPEKTTRGRALLRHRQYLPNDYELIAEIGWISDYNFLEEYLENEWDSDVDHRTALRLRKYIGSQMIDLSAKAQVNDFFTVDEQLPLLEHYLIGGSLLNDWFTYSAHNKVGYTNLNVGLPPTDPVQAAAMSPIPGQVNAGGIVAGTRQELQMPINIGPVKLVPSISGEASHYGEATDGSPLTRLVGQAGMRASLQMWRIDPSIESSLLNVRGLAHKLEWTAEYFYADSNTNFEELPLYNQLDDISQTQFRSRFIQNTFGGALPSRFDPRTYALRHGLQKLVASPSDVIADDLQQVGLGLNQRWQTKRGLPGRERITDLFQFDMNLLLFPNADRDNFGETVGPATYDMRYHIGDRVTFLTDGYFDFFEQGLRSISGGFRTSRPGLGDAYLGLLSLEGPISSTVLINTLDYRMNEKWILSAGTTYDFGPTGNVGQTLAVTRIGESLLLQVAVNIDRARSNTSVGFLVEPRFWPSSKRGRVGGQLIAPPGIEGLE